MKIEKEEIEQMTLEQFADKHNLIMVVKERETESHSNMRYCAYFKNTEIKEGIFLKGEYGNGHTPEAAIGEYKHKICFRLLVVNAMSKDRKEIKIPRLI